MRIGVERRIAGEAKRIVTARLDTRAVLLADSYAHGQQWPHSDVDLIAVVADIPARKDATLDLGRQTLALPEPTFRDTLYAGKYQRTTNT